MSAGQRGHRAAGDYSVRDYARGRCRSQLEKIEGLDMCRFRRFKTSSTARARKRRCGTCAKHTSAIGVLFNARRQVAGFGTKRAVQRRRHHGVYQGADRLVEHQGFEGRAGGSQGGGERVSIRATVHGQGEPIWPKSRRLCALPRALLPSRQRSAARPVVRNRRRTCFKKTQADGSISTK